MVGLPLVAHAALSIALILVAMPAQTPPPPFRFVKDLIPASAHPVLGVADFDLDGDKDLATNGSGILLNDGHGRFSPHPWTSGLWAFPGGGSGSFNAGQSAPLCAIGDLNGDYYPDVIALDSSGFVYKWINQGNGVLTGYPLGSTFTNGIIRALAIGDVDGDLDFDVVVSRYTANWFNPGGSPAPMLLWLNDGTSTFTAGTGLPPAPMTPTQLALVDLNGDGAADLLTGNMSYAQGPPTSAPLVFMNGGTGTFAPTGVALPAASSFDIAAIGHVNGDAFPDIVLDHAPVWPSSWSPCSGNTAPAPVVLVNDGTGSFAPATSVGMVGPLFPAIPRLADMDGDGLNDLVRITPLGFEAYNLNGSMGGSLLAQVSLYASPDNPEYASRAISNASSDLDGDGDEDFVLFTGQGNQVLFNSGNQPVAVTDSLVTRRQTPSHVFSAGDIEGDGDSDLILGVFPCAPGTITLDAATNDGRGNLAEGLTLPWSTSLPASSPGNMAAFDADADGDLDMYCGFSAQYVLLNNGIALNVSQTFAGSCLKSIPADLDGDGDTDVVAAMNGQSNVVLNDGTGFFQLGNPLTTPTIFDAVVFDADQDGDLDVATAGVVRLFLNDGVAGFTLTPSLPYLWTTQIVEGDFDTDGITDLVLGNMICRNSPPGVFTLAGTIPFANWANGATDRDFRSFDFDGDGDVDIVDSKGWLYRNLGGLSFQGVLLPRALTNPIVLADFDADGDQDLVTHGPAILTNMTRQLSRGTPPRPGRPATLELGGAPGTAWHLFASTGAGGLPLPGIGTVRLDLATVQYAGPGLIPVGGLSTVSGITPTSPGIIGFTTYWQAVMIEPSGPRLTGLEVITVAAY